MRTWNQICRGCTGGFYTSDRSRKECSLVCERIWKRRQARKHRLFMRRQAHQVVEAARQQLVAEGGAL